MHATDTADYSLTLANGDTVRAPTLLTLAGKWAETEWGDQWKTLSPAQQSLEISAALNELTRRYRNGK